MDYSAYKNIPNRLKQCRRHRGLSQKELADLMGFKDTTWISRWENGDTLPNLISAIRLSVLFDIPVNSLFGEIVNRVQKENQR
jgi:transcriptional regulator with XRE-family HTH domain